MPTYEYKCRDCGYRFEKFQQMSDKPLKKCPECAGKLRRLIGTGAGIIFNGSGFYENDYKRNSA
jgi:putative FmdB family regulatory protein